MAEVDSHNRDTLLNSVRTLEPLIREHTDEAERNGRLSQVVAAALAEAGVFRMYIPKSLGGLEILPLTSYRVVEEVARIDGSAGWCAFIGSACCALGAFLSDTAAEKIYGTDPGVITSAVVFPPGKAVVRDGGYVVSGRWSYGSGCHHSAWTSVACNVFENDQMRLDDGVPEMRMFYVPRADVTILEDSWQVSGFAGTGSHDVTLEETFVPKAYSYRFGPGMPRGTHYQSPLYNNYPFMALFGFPMGAVALGIAQGAIDAVMMLAESKKPAGQTQTLRERAVFHFQLADAVALVESARAWLYASVDQAWEVVAGGGEVSLEERGRLVLAAANATRSAAQATDIAYTAAGGTANYLTSPLQRALRNIHALTQHVTTSPQQFESAGRMMLGLAPSFPLFLL